MQTQIRLVVMALTTLLGLPGSAGTTLQEPQPNFEDEDRPEPVKPLDPEPTERPPAPPDVIPDPVTGQSIPRPSQETLSGQWVYTNQYEWVWMPYGKTYSSLPPDGSTPNMYVYYPAEGWCWVVAPWVWGWGVMPSYGLLGCSNFSWYGNGFGLWCGYVGRSSRPGHGGWGYYRQGTWRSTGPADGRSLSSPWRSGSANPGVSRSAWLPRSERAALPDHGRSLRQLREVISSPAEHGRSLRQPREGLGVNQDHLRSLRQPRETLSPGYDRVRALSRPEGGAPVLGHVRQLRPESISPVRSRSIYSPGHDGGGGAAAFGHSSSIVAAISGSAPTVTGHSLRTLGRR